MLRTRRTTSPDRRRARLALGAALVLTAAAIGSVFQEPSEATAVAVPAEVASRASSSVGSPPAIEPLGRQSEVQPPGTTGERVRVRERVRIRGRVVTGAGEPIASATVHAKAGVEETTSASGEFWFQGLDDGVYWLHAEASGFAPRPAPPVRLGPDTVEDVELVLEPAHTLTGQVRSERGTALAGARVEAGLRAVDALPGAELEGGSSARRVSVLCDESGGFRIGPWPAGDVELVVTHDRHTGWGRVVRSDRQDLAIVLPESPGAIGWIVGNTTPRPVGVAVLVSLAEAEGPWRLLEPCREIGDVDGSGRFRTAVTTSRWVRLLAQGPTFGVALSEPFRIDRRARQASVPLTVWAAAPVNGHVHDPDGHPLADAEVVFRRADDPALPLQPGALLELARARTAPDGSFSTPPVPGGSYRVDTSCTGFRARTLSLAFAPHAPAPLAVELRAGGSIRGRLRNVDGGELPELWIEARRATAGDRDDVPTTARVVDGDFLLSGLAAGSHALSLIARHDVACRAAGPTVRVDVGEEVRVDLSPASFGLCTVRGSVEIDGAPQPLRTVHLQHARGGAGLDCVTDARGGFCFAGIPEGAYRLGLRGAPREPTHPGGAVVELPLAQPARIDLGRRTTIRL